MNKGNTTVTLHKLGTYAECTRHIEADWYCANALFPKPTESGQTTNRELDCKFSE